MINFLLHKENAKFLKFLYDCPKDKWLTINKGSYKQWDEIIVKIMNNGFFRFEWIFNLSPEQMVMIAKFFEIPLPEWHKAIHNGKIHKDKMFDDDKKRHLYLTIKKFIFKFSKDNTQFIKESVKF